MMIPTLRQLIDEINSRGNKTLTFKYKDGKVAVLKVMGNTVSVESSEPRLVKTLGSLLERVLQGDVKGLDLS